MMTNLNTVADVVDILGGRAPTAELLEVGPNAVSNWTSAGKFPAELYIMVQEELGLRNLVAPTHLFKMRKRQRKRKTRGR